MKISLLDKFIKKNKTTEIDKNLCNNLTDDKDCSLILKIKELQSKINDINKQIDEMKYGRMDPDNIQSLLHFLKIMSTCHYIRKLNCYEHKFNDGITNLELYDILDCIGRIEDIDNMVEEIRKITKYENIIENLIQKRCEYEAQVKELKLELGIECRS